MRTFLAILCLAVLAAARPDVSHLGYNYHNGFSGTTVSPSISSNGIAIESTIAPTLAPLGVSTTLAPTLAPLGLTSTIAPDYGFNAGNLFSSTALPIGGYSFGSYEASAIPSTLAPFGVTSDAFNNYGFDVTSTLAPFGLAANNFGLAANNFGYDGLAASGFIRHQTPVVSKHFYVHSAPEEANEEYHRHLVLGTPQKSYRVVFIKAPSQQTATRISASFAPTEEKTVIYVLSKKPEDLQINDIQAPPPTEPSKPEVFFIKYKTPEEAAHAQQQIQAQYDALGGFSQVSNEGVAPLTSVIGSLGQSVSEIDIANARFDAVHAPVQYSTPLNLGAIHHVGTPYSTVAPTFGAFGDAFSQTTLGPAFSTVSPLLSSFAPGASSFAPGVSTFDSAISTLEPFLSTTLAPAVSTIAPEAEVKYLPPKKH